MDCFKDQRKQNHSVSLTHTANQTMQHLPSYNSPVTSQGNCEADPQYS